MSKNVMPPRIRALQEPSFQHQRISTMFLNKTLSPSAQLTTAITRYATDGTFNHDNGRAFLVR